MMKYHNTGGAGKTWGYLEVKKFSPYSMDGVKLTFEARMGAEALKFPRLEDGSIRTDIVLSREQLVDLHRRLGEHLGKFDTSSGLTTIIEGEEF